MFVAGDSSIAVRAGGFRFEDFKNGVHREIINSATAKCVNSAIAKLHAESPSSTGFLNLMKQSLI